MRKVRPSWVLAGSALQHRGRLPAPKYELAKLQPLGTRACTRREYTVLPGQGVANLLSVTLQQQTRLRRASDNVWHLDWEEAFVGAVHRIFHGSHGHDHPPLRLVLCVNVRLHAGRSHDALEQQDGDHGGGRVPGDATVALPRPGTPTTYNVQLHVLCAPLHPLWG